MAFLYLSFESIRGSEGCTFDDIACNLFRYMLKLHYHVLRRGKMKKILLLLLIIASIFLVSCQVDWSLIDTSMFEKAPEIYTVSFDTMGGSEIADMQIEENSTVKRPKNPTRDGFEFDGWYTENDEKYQF